MQIQNRRYEDASGPCFHVSHRSIHGLGKFIEYSCFRNKKTMMQTANRLLLYTIATDDIRLLIKMNLQTTSTMTLTVSSMSTLKEILHSFGSQKSSRSSDLTQTSRFLNLYYMVHCINQVRSPQTCYQSIIMNHS